MYPAYFGLIDCQALWFLLLYLPSFMIFPFKNIIFLHILYLFAASSTHGHVRELHRRTLKVDLEDALEGASAT